MTLNENTIDIVFKRAEAIPVLGGMLNTTLLGGAISELPVDGTAFVGRVEHVGMEMIAFWTPNNPDDGEKLKGWVTDTYKALTDQCTGVYANFIGNEEDNKTPERLLLAFGSNLPQLRELKRKYDPHNFFHHNTNIVPAST